MALLPGDEPVSLMVEVRQPLPETLPLTLMVEWTDPGGTWMEPTEIYPPRVLMVTPRPREPGHPSGKAFAARNPDRGPYWWFDWTDKTGALLLPNASVPALHQLLDEVEAEVRDHDDSWGEYVPPRAPSPWGHVDGEWWPKAADDD